MLKRPNANDTEDDILRMQNDFLNEKKQQTSFQPAAKLVKVESSEYDINLMLFHCGII